MKSYVLVFSTVFIDLGKTKYKNLNGPIVFSDMDKVLNFIADYFLTLCMLEEGPHYTTTPYFGEDKDKPSFHAWIKIRSSIELYECGIDGLNSKSYNNDELLKLLEDNYPHIESKLLLISENGDDE